MDQPGSRRRCDRRNGCLWERPEGTRQVADRAVPGICLLRRWRADAVAARVVHNEQGERAVSVVIVVCVGQRQRCKR